MNDTEDGLFTIILEKETFTIIDKRQSNHQKYELVRGPDKIWGLTNILTREWFPIDSDRESYFPDLDLFFGTSESRPITHAIDKLHKKNAPT